MNNLLTLFWYRGICRANGHKRGGAAYLHCFGLLLNASALWVGAHYSPAHKRWCVNILPCVTVWWAKPGGKLP